MNERKKQNDSQSQNFGEAEFITTVHHLPTMLICPSPSKLGQFYLYQKNKSKRLSNGTAVSYFECSTCTKLGDQKGRVTVKENCVMNNPDLGHNMLCSPLDRESMEALKLERQMLELCLARVHPRQSYTQILASIGDKFDDLNFRQSVALKVSPFKSLRSSLYRSYRRGRLESNCSNPSILPSEYQNLEDSPNLKIENENDWNESKIADQNANESNVQSPGKKCCRNSKKRKMQHNKRSTKSELNENENNVEYSIVDCSCSGEAVNSNYGDKSTQTELSPETVDELLLQFILGNEGMNA